MRCPRSRRAFGRWWATTALGRITKIPSGALDHRRFWDAMDHVAVDTGGVDRVDEIETALTRKMIDVLDLDTHALILDVTNFATFVDSGNARAPIATRFGTGTSSRALPPFVTMGARFGVSVHSW